MIYWLIFNLALFLCTIKFATHIYRSTAVHDVSITNSFCASNCALFNSSVYVCYMWQWVMWRVTGSAEWRLDRCVYIYIVDVMWFVLLKPIIPLLCTKIRHCKKYFQLPQWQSAILWIYQLMNALNNELHMPMVQTQYHSELHIFISMSSKWTLQSVH